jgi:hypothetical protein
MHDYVLNRLSPPENAAVQGMITDHPGSDERPGCILVSMTFGECAIHLGREFGGELVLLKLGRFQHEHRNRISISGLSGMSDLFPLMARGEVVPPTVPGPGCFS